MNSVFSFLAKMNPTMRLLLGIVVVALFAFALYQYVYTPQAAALQAETRKYKESGPDASLLALKIKKAKEKATLPTGIKQEDRDRLGAQGNKLFDAAAEKDFVVRLPRIASGAGLMDFAFKTDAAAAQKVVVRIDIGKGAMNSFTVDKIPVSMGFKCSFASLNRFEQKLRDENRYIRVGGLKLKSENNTAELDVEQMTIYLYAEEGS